MIIVTEEAKALLGTIEHPEGTVLRLDPVAQDQATQQITLGFGPGEPHSDDQIVEQEGEEVLRIAAPVSGLLNGSTMDVMVQEESENGAERPSVVIGIRPPGHEPPTSGS